MAKNKKNKQEEMQDDPTPRFRYDGSVHPLVNKPVFRTDGSGLLAARREIMNNPRLGSNHPGLAYIDFELSELKRRAEKDNLELN